MAGFLGVITRLRNPLLASLRDSPKPRLEIFLFITGSGKSPEAKRERRCEAEGAFTEPIYYILNTN